MRLLRTLSPQLPASARLLNLTLRPRQRPTPRQDQALVVWMGAHGTPLNRDEDYKKSECTVMLGEGLPMRFSDCEMPNRRNAVLGRTERR